VGLEGIVTGINGRIQILLVYVWIPQRHVTVTLAGVPTLALWAFPRLRPLASTGSPLSRNAGVSTVVNSQLH
jgi:hypothetical protein